MQGLGWLFIVFPLHAASYVTGIVLSAGSWVVRMHMHSSSVVDFPNQQATKIRMIDQS